MGSSSSVFKAHNEVHIMQSGGCAGGGDCSCGTATFDEAMDPKLQPYLTQQEYKSVLGKAKQDVRRHGIKWYYLMMGTPFFVLASIASQLIKEETIKCNAANGECTQSQTPAADQCCRYTCCPGQPDRRLEGLNGSAVASDFLSPSGAEDTTRSLLTARRMQGFTCFTHDATERTVCMCRMERIDDKGNTRERCDGVITITGESTITPPVVWPLPVMILGWAVGMLFSAVYPLYLQCTLKEKINPALEPWRQKGLRAEYKPGSKHYQARIAVWTPEAVQVVGTAS